MAHQVQGDPMAYPGACDPVAHPGHDTPGACDPLTHQGHGTLVARRPRTRHPGQGDPMTYQDKTCQPICTLRALRSLGMETQWHPGTRHQVHVTQWHMTQ
jgi:hypothetical protein